MYITVWLVLCCNQNSAIFSYKLQLGVSWHFVLNVYDELAKLLSDFVCGICV